MTTPSKCEHGYDHACLMCGFGTVDGRRIWSDWAMVRQRQSVERYAAKLIELEEALTRCDNDATIEKYDTIGILSSALSRSSKFIPGEEVVYLDPIGSDEIFVVTQVHKDGVYEVKTASRGWPVPESCWGFYPKEHEIRKASKAEKLVKKRIFENVFIHKSSGRMYTLLHVTNQMASKEEWEPQAVYKSERGEVYSRPLTEFLEKFKVDGCSPILDSATIR